MLPPRGHGNPVANIGVELNKSCNKYTTQYPAIVKYPDDRQIAMVLSGPIF